MAFEDVLANYEAARKGQGMLRADYNENRFAIQDSLDAALAQKQLEEEAKRIVNDPVLLEKFLSENGMSKSGVSPNDAGALAQVVLSLPRLRLRGLMCIPDPAPDWQAQCAVFRQARDLYERWRDRGWAIDTLSMGMSGDLEAAVASGSTMVRVGSALFGHRHYPTPV